MLLDIILVLVLIIGAMRGYRKGLSNILVGLIGLILAIILAFMFKGTIANMIITNTQVDENMNTFMVDSVTESLNSKAENSDLYTMLIKNLNLTGNAQTISSDITKFIIESACFIGIFIIVTIAVAIIKGVLNLVFELPILNGLNKMGGLVAGCAMTLAKIWILLILIQIISPLFPEVMSFIQNTYAVKLVYENNIISKLLLP